MSRLTYQRNRITFPDHDHQRFDQTWPVMLLWAAVRRTDHLFVVGGAHREARRPCTVAVHCARNPDSAGKASVLTVSS